MSPKYEARLYVEAPWPGLAFGSAPCVTIPTLTSLILRPAPPTPHPLFPGPGVGLFELIFTTKKAPGARP